MAMMGIHLTASELSYILVNIYYLRYTIQIVAALLSSLETLISFLPLVRSYRIGP